MPGQCLAHLCDALTVARDGDLRGPVVVRHHRAPEWQRVLDNAIDLFSGETDDRGHRPLRATRGGEAAALGNEAESILERENTSGDERRELAERMARHEAWA